jgi:hypothetical protein
MSMIPIRALVLMLSFALAACDRSADAPAGGSESEAQTTGTTSADHDHEQDHEFCDCMLVHCHDDFHEAWGESDLEATLNCRDEAATLPRKGEPTLAGDFIECRMGHCQLAAQQGDETPCPAALGDAPCDG